MYARPPHYVYSISESFHHEAQVLKQYQQLTSTLFTNTDEILWINAPSGMYLTDVKEKILWRNDKTSAMMLLTKTPVGISSAVHNHPDANQWLMGISGEVETSTGKRHTIEGAFSFVPKGVMHGARKVTTKCLAYVYFDGPRTKQFVTDQFDR